MTMQERLKQLRLKKELEVEDLSELTAKFGKKIAPKTIYGYEGGSNIPLKRAKQLAASLGVSAKEFVFGADTPHDVYSTELPRIPLLDMNKLGTLKVGQPPREVWNEVSLMSVQSVGLSPQAFSVVIQDDSVTPEFKRGEVVVFDPSAPLVPGKLILVVIEKEKLALIGRYRPATLNNKRQFTVAMINPDYPDVQINTHNPGFIVGCAVQHTRFL